ncbi:hypothetical protein ET495_01925 [Xylanimonas allomyrinae]|uniref:Nitroreductase family deazaflavin-dependent oxidoreductase n=1 Tax=Xylanimonas allomyrinae TaxID=2509459 RepID=A0A4P6EIW2_9MICO|nr:hypothetical protein [Xylanimonas allomyrinae]QAY62235.1 hypothetical protein ET495_01925 [Xylanimonas allomyrinae]
MAVSPRVAPLMKRVNPHMVKFAKRVPPWVVITHVGRVSHRTFTTPLVAFAAREPLDLSVTAAPGLPVETKGVRDILVAIPLPWGDDTDWAQNVLAAGRFELTRKGVTYSVTEPHVVDAEEASRVGVKAAAATRLLGVGTFLVGTLHTTTLPDL